MATAVHKDGDVGKTEKDPLASHLIPETIEDRRYEAEGRITTYRRGKLLGKVQFIA